MSKKKLSERIPNYPGRKKLERSVEPLVRPAAKGFVSNMYMQMAGWWFMRQHGTRKELVELGVVSRSASYRHEKAFEELIGAPVEKVTGEQLAKWAGLDKIPEPDTEP